MKILMLGWELPPHMVGGMGTVCYNLCDYLARSGADIEFILPFEAKFDINFMNINPVKGATFKDLYSVSANAYGKLPRDSQLSGGSTQTAYDRIHNNYMKKVAKVSVLGEYDVIHAHDWMTFRAGLLAKQITNKPLIVHIHATEFDRSGGKAGNEMIHEIEYMGLSMADKVIAISHRVKGMLVDKYQIDPAKIEIVHNQIDLNNGHLAVDGSSENAFQSLVKLKEHGYRIVNNVGRITMQKGLTHLLEAAKIALQHNPKIIFLVVGSGDQKIELLRKAAYLGIGANVLFVDFQNGQRLRDSYAIGDLFVMPSVSEPFGLGALEAIGLETATMISNQSGVAEVLTNVLKLDFWDINEMANQIVAVTKYDGLRNELQKSSYEEFKTQSWAKAADETNNVYNRAIGAAL